MLHVITGDGKGKTTAAAGLALRAAGHGLSVLFVQLLKDGDSGEVRLLRGIPSVEVQIPSVNHGFTFQMSMRQLEETRFEDDRLLELAITSDRNLVVVDEVLYALAAGVVDQERVRVLAARCDAEVVLTGNPAPKWLVEMADYVSEVRKVKHPYDRGVAARMGIEY